MDNLIPPINNPQISAPSTDKPLGGIIENVPSKLPQNSVLPGQSAMLEVLANSKNTIAETLVGKIQVMLREQMLEIPVEVKLETPMKLPADQPVNNLNIRLSPQPNGALAVRIVAVNNESPEKFAVRNPENTIRPQFSSSALINDTGAKLPPLETAPLKTTAIIEKLATELKLPPQQVQTLVKQFAEVTGQVSILPRPVVMPQSPAAEPMQNTPAQQIPQSFSDLPRPVADAVQNIKTAIVDFVAGKTSLPQTVVLIKNEFMALKSFSIPAEITSHPENGVTMIRSPLADVLIANPVKIGSGLPVLLKLEDFVQKFDDKLLPLLPEHLSTAAKAGLPSPKMPLIDGLLKILQPLTDKGQSALAAAVLNKIPDPSTPRMLANMVAYIKATGEHNISRWLGSEIMDKLSATTEGREVASKLGSMFVASHQDSINWRIMEIPVMNGDTMSKIRIAIKKILDEEEKKKAKENRNYGTRFVVDTNFTHLGSFQFDGYSMAKDKRFDLIVRTERDIGADFCANMMRLFKNTLHEEGYVGNVKINVKEKFIKIEDNQFDGETLADGIYI